MWFANRFSNRREGCHLWLRVFLSQQIQSLLQLDILLSKLEKFWLLHASHTLQILVAKVEFGTQVVSFAASRLLLIWQDGGGLKARILLRIAIVNSDSLMAWFGSSVRLLICTVFFVLDKLIQTRVILGWCYVLRLTSKLWNFFHHFTIFFLKTVLRGLRLDQVLLERTYLLIQRNSRLLLSFEFYISWFLLVFYLFQVNFAPFISFVCFFSGKWLLSK